MALDLRPDLDLIFEAFGAAARVGPHGGTMVVTTAIRLSPAAARPHLEADGVAVDTSPRFSFLRSEVPELALDDALEITEGVDVGWYSIARIEDPDLDGQMVHVVATRR